MSPELEKLLNRAQLCHKQGECEEAVGLYQQVLSINPQHAEACFYLALLLADAGQHEKALSLLTKTNQLQPQQPAIIYQLGVCQYTLGQIDEAVASFGKVMQLEKDHWQAAYNLGAIYYSADQISKSIAAYSLAARTNSQDADIFFNLGLAYKQAGEFERAVDSYSKAAAISPDDPDIHYNLGRLYNDIGQRTDAMASLQTAVSLRPDFGAALSNLAALYTREDMAPEAIVVYEKLIEIDHNPTAARHILNALQGKATDTAPISYIKELYDDFSGHFEKRLVQDLGYRTPQKIVDFLRCHNAAESYGQMLDLGCGTGLCGEVFKNIVGSLTGVDLSGKMLEKAQKKNIYTQLYENDIISYLTDISALYDLIVAGDVLIYMGDLQDLFRLLAKRLAESGIIVFSTEHLECADGFKLRPTGRYAHSRSYIDAVVTQNNLQLVAVESANLRKEKERWIVGDMYILAHA